MATARSHDLRRYLIQAAGRTIDEFADGDAIVVAPADDDTRAASGADGNVVFSATNNALFTVTLNLAATSPANAIFSQIVVDASLNPNSVGAFRFVLRDTTVGLDDQTRVAGVAVIQRRPDVSVGKDSGTRAWTLALTADSGGWFAGGSNEL